MKKTNLALINVLCNVVERFQFHSEMTKSENPIISEASTKMCEVEMWEMWELTQG